MALLPASDTLGGVRLGLRLKNSVFLAEAPEAVISEEHIYNIIMPDYDQDKLVDAMSKDFEKIIKKRC